MDVWAVAGFLTGFAFWITGLLLAAYLDLRIHALRKSGDLPLKTPQLFSYGLGSVYPKISLLYSRGFREIDGHTGLLTPAIRIFLPLGAALCVGSAAWHMFSR